jgi:hypothetical protein
VYDVELAIEMLQSDIDIVNFVPTMLAVQLDVEHREDIPYLQFGGISLQRLIRKGNLVSEDKVHLHRLHRDQIYGDSLTMWKIASNFHYPGML